MIEMYDVTNSLTLGELLMNGVKYLKNLGIEGSTTVVTAKLEPFEDDQQKGSADMTTLNLGDSGYIILRPSA